MYICLYPKTILANNPKDQLILLEIFSNEEKNSSENFFLSYSALALTISLRWSDASADRLVERVINKSNKKAYFVRDRLGQKPLYYKFNEKRVIFCSNLKSILDIDNIP